MVRFAKDYELRDVAVVFTKGPWNSWRDLVHWLKTDGLTQSGFALGELARMIADFGVLDEENVPFVTDPGIAYELAQEHRRTTAVEGALHWIERIDRLEEANEALPPSGSGSASEGEARQSSA